jgi:AraC family transcriptional regulator
MAVLQAVELMRARLAEGVSLEEMAVTTGLSPFHFARLFKAATGHPPHEYLVRLRVDRAQELISSHGRTHTMAAIAQASGFADQSHMTRHFRRVLGMTPGEFAEARRNSAA